MENQEAKLGQVEEQPLPEVEEVGPHPHHLEVGQEGHDTRPRQG